MEIAGILSILQVVASNLPGAISTVEQLSSLGQELFSTINGKAPTADEIAALEAGIDSDVADALTPLPAAQPGDPDYTP